MDKLALWPEQDSAVGYYRILQPGRFLKREGFVKEVRTVPFSGYGQAAYRRYSDKTFMEICSGAHSLHATLLWKQEDLLKALNLREWSGCRLIFDIDDNIFAASPDNPAKETAAILEKNRLTCLRMADAVTVSVPNLKKIYEPLNKEIFTQPNGLDFSVLDRIEVKRKKRLRVVWRGAYGHRGDLEIIRPVIAELKKAYDFDFVCFGYDPGFADEYVPWVPFFKKEIPFYYRTLGELAPDIAVVPLADTAYNRCKSNIGCLEWSALKVPVVFSPVENQKDTPGLVAKTSFEWYAALEMLLKDAARRKKIGERQYGWAKENYDMKKLAVPFAGWLEGLPRRTDLAPDLAP